MLLTLTTTHTPATDLGYLLGKHPQKPQSFDLPFGKAHVFSSCATDERCTMCLLLDVDSVALARSDQSPYVSDRPYVTSSFTSVAIARVFRSALQGTSKEKPALASAALPFTATLHQVPAAASLVRLLFEPLGYVVDVEESLLDPQRPEWGNSPGLLLRLTKTTPLHELLAHLDVLLPVLDDEKHYFVGHDEVDKLLAHGEGWLKDHPARDLITRRYLKHLRSLTDDALARLTVDDPVIVDDAVAGEVAEARVSLNAQRFEAVIQELRAREVSTVIDLGCGEGKLLKQLLKDRSFSRVVGVDVSMRALQLARDRLRLDEEKKQDRVSLLQGSLTYQDQRFCGFDAAVLVEVIEHLELSRLPTLARVVFGHAKPRVVVVTTPNAEHNAKYGLAPGAMRHADHRFEWTRSQYKKWAEGVAAEFAYSVSFSGIGDEDDVLGAPTQMAVFTQGKEDT